MKLANNIGWCDETINAVTGCDKVSAGCKNCYAERGTRARVLRSQGVETWGPHGVRYPVNFRSMFRRLNKLCICDECHGSLPAVYLEYPDGAPRRCPKCNGLARRIRLFADSNSDWLDERWPLSTLAQFLDAVRKALNIDTILLTKRPENFKNRLRAVLEVIAAEQEGEFYESDEDAKLVIWMEEWVRGNAPKHIWIGVSVENQEMADRRIPQVLKIPAAIRFLSMEPLLESVDLDEFLYPVTQPVRRALTDQLHWVIVGGESGAGRRDCGADSICWVAGQCISAGVPAYVKQDCAFKSGQQGRIPDDVWNLKQFPKQKR